MAAPTLVELLDAQIAALFADWSLATTALALVILAFVAYPIFSPDEPDTHPLLLARQSHVAPIRNKNESAVYRSPEVPYGSLLRSGLNVRDAKAPRWAAGKDGDVRDVWREVMRGGQVGDDGKTTVPKGLIMTVLGREEIIEHEIEALAREINVLGQTWRAAGVKRIAVYLPNSAEFLMTVFGELVSTCIGPSLGCGCLG